MSDTAQSRPIPLLSEALIAAFRHSVGAERLKTGKTRIHAEAARCFRRAVEQGCYSCGIVDGSGGDVEAVLGLEGTSSLILQEGLPDRALESRAQSSMRSNHSWPGHVSDSLLDVKLNAFDKRFLT